MDKYLKIQSKGEIEEKAFTLLGNSTKKNDNQTIGYFGSGLKYSISSMLRNNIPFIVFSGEKRLDFTVQSETFRNEEFQVITINGTQTSFTTKMGGKDWDTPFAPLREIYSNALDEDEESILTETIDTTPKKGHTTFFILMNESVEDFYKNHHLYFCNRNPKVLFSNEYGSVYRSYERKLILFRRGIRCTKELDEDTAFNYNSKYFRINESRVLDSDHQARTVVAYAWKQCNDKSLITDLLIELSHGNTGRYEHKLNWDGALYKDGNIFSQIPCEFSNAWKEITEENKFVSVEHLDMFDENEIIGRRILPFNLLKVLQARVNPEIDILGIKYTEEAEEPFVVIKQPSEKLTNKVIDSLARLQDTVYNERITPIPKIVYVKFSDKSILGQAEKGKILLSENIVDLSVDEVAKIIIEENEHIRTGFDDESRAFQNHLFNLYFESITN